MQKTNKIILIIILVLAVGIAGYFIGKNQSQQEVDRLTEIVEMTYPEPDEVISRISGVVKNVQGATIYLEADNPERYLPNSKKPEKVTKYVSISNQTNITTIDSSTESDNPKTSEMSISDIKEGDEVTVISEENIRTSQKFQATEIKVLSL